jgi:predicted metal-dependent peptidase
VPRLADLDHGTRSDFIIAILVSTEIGSYFVDDVAVTELIARFQRIVARDGGELTLLGADTDTIRVAYRVGAVDPDCADGACVLPEAELQQLMSETVARRSPGVRVEVEVRR